MNAPPPGTPKATAATASALTTPPTMITREQALLGLKAMELRGRRPRIFNLERPASTDKDSFNQLSGRSDGGGGDGGGGGGGGQDSINSKASESVKGKDANATSSAGATNFDVLFDAAVAESPATKGLVAAVSKKSINGGRGDGHTRSDDSKRVVADIAVLVRTLEEGVSGAGGVGPLHWGWLSCAEAGERSKRLYREASHAQVFFLHLILPSSSRYFEKVGEGRLNRNILKATYLFVRYIKQKRMVTRRTARKCVILPPPQPSHALSSSWETPHMLDAESHEASEEDKHLLYGEYKIYRKAAVRVVYTIIRRDMSPFRVPAVLDTCVRSNISLVVHRFLR